MFIIGKCVDFPPQTVFSLYGIRTNRVPRLRVRNGLITAGSIVMLPKQVTHIAFQLCVLTAAFLAPGIVGQQSTFEFGYAQAAEAEHNIPDFTGYWARPEAPNFRTLGPPNSGPGPVTNSDDTGIFMIGDYSNPILLPNAVDAVRAHGDLGRDGRVKYQPWALCLPAGVPHVLNLAGPIQFLQSEDQVTILYQRGQQIRHVYLNQEHPENLQPSWYGHSVGHYEGGNTLVVDTIAQGSRSAVDNFGTPKSEAIHVVERYVLSSDPQRINITLFIEDPNVFAGPWSASASYVWVSTRRNYTGTGDYQERIAPLICQENNRDAVGERDVPVDDTPDF